jgi:hypothetical protein
LEKRAEQVLPRSDGDGGRWIGWRAGGRHRSNNVYTYESMNKQEKKGKTLPFPYIIFNNHLTLTNNLLYLVFLFLLSYYYCTEGTL